MVDLKKNRTLTKNDNIECYKNLQSDEVTIRNRTSRIIVGQGNEFILEEVTLKKLKKRGKNGSYLQPTIVGKFMSMAMITCHSLNEIYYDDSISQFVSSSTNEPITSVDKVYIGNDNQYYLLE